MATVRGRLPDFVVIGAMKCGTSTLHAQLALQPGVFMTTEKEPCFFSDDKRWARGLGWYRSLFAAAAESDRCGESSTHYTKLPTFPDTVLRARRHLGPDARFVYLVRHPVERLVSHWIHEWSRRAVPRSIDAAIDRHPELVDYGRYAMQLEPWLDAFGPERILPVFLERLGAAPHEECARIGRFLELPAPFVWSDECARENESARRRRRVPLLDALLRAPAARVLRRTLVPERIRERVKARWMMRERPLLSPARTARLETIFDRDLAVLGHWLGVELRCATFGRIAAATSATFERLTKRREVA